MPNKANEVKTPIAEETNTTEKIVTIKIPRDRSTDEDFVVWVNEKRYQIQRGIPVDVPESVALIIEEHERIEEEAYNRRVSMQK